jgi:hypothetical protein
MTPSAWTALLLATTALIYAGTALAYWLGVRPGMALAFVGYAMANVGFIIDAMGGGK